jgi:hypothetical protein
MLMMDSAKPSLSEANRISAMQPTAEAVRVGFKKMTKNTAKQQGLTMIFSTRPSHCTYNIVSSRF